MRQVFSRLFGSLKAGLATGVIIGAAATLPVVALAENGNAAQDTAQSVKISKESQLKGETNNWSANNTAKPGDTLKYIISYQNTGSTEQKQVVIRDSLPAKMELVPGTTMLHNQSNPDGSKVDSDAITGGGIIIGNYGPGANAYVTFEVKVPAADRLECGNNEFRNIGVVRPENMNEQHATAVTKVQRDCDKPASPAPVAPTSPAPTPPAAPTIPTAGDKDELPAAGAGSLIGLFVAASAIGFVGHRLFLNRRLSR